MTTRRDILTDGLLGLGALSLSSLARATPAAPPAAPKPTPAAGLPTGDVHDFDFLVGEWTSANRRLKQRWVRSNDWDEFPGKLSCETKLGSVVNIDQADFPTKGWSGVTVRTFDLQNRRWSLYWINNRTGTLFPPVLGGFTGKHGEFYGDDEDDGRRVKVQFVWNRISDDVVRWQQAFSLDGTQWEINWTAEHRRVKHG